MLYGEEVASGSQVSINLLKNSSEDSVEDVETDIDVSQFIKKIHIIEEDLPEYDKTHRTYYISQCRLLNVIPSNIFLRNIETDSLIMPHYGLRAKGVKPIVNTLVYNKTISKINLSDNWLCDEGINYIMTMVRTNEVITELDLSYNKLTNACSQVLSETLANSPILLRLDLSHNNFNDESAGQFGELMILSLRLEYLNLSYNHFANRCLAAFGKAFFQTTSIIHLDLSFNHISGSDDDFSKFIKGLSKNQCFKHLDLSSNGFSSVPCLNAFGKMLKVNVVLEELNLSNNRIGAEAAVEFAKSLPGCKALQILRIGRNPMMTAGCYAIVNFILANPEPKFYILDFESIEVNDDFKVLESKLIQYIPDILVLTGVRMIKRIFPNVDPILRMKLLSMKRQIKVVDFFQRYTNEVLVDCVLLDDMKQAIEDFCVEYEFKLLDMDKRRIYKSFPRNAARTVSLKVIASMFDEEYSVPVQDYEMEKSDIASNEKDKEFNDNSSDIISV